MPVFATICAASTVWITLVMLLLVVSGAPASPLEIVTIFASARACDRGRDLWQHLDLPVAEVRLAAGLDRLVHLLDALRGGIRDPADANGLGVGRASPQAHLPIGPGLRDLRARAQPC
jgi:hypothetical protein